jgi:DNA repair protein RadC
MDLETLYMTEFPGTHFHVQLVREEFFAQPAHQRPIQDKDDAYLYLKDGLENRDRETFVSLLLDARLVPLGVNLVAVGQLDQARVHSREVFKAAILASAKNLILAHNHPSGDPQPSGADRDITVGLVWAGKILGIQVLDHIIVGRDSYQSLGDLCKSVWAKELPTRPALQAR